MPTDNTGGAYDFYNSELPAAYAKLATQPIDVQRLFCAACCERLYPHYVIYHRLTGVGSAEKLRKIIDILWDTEIEQVARGSRRTIWLDLDQLILPGYRGTFWSILAEFVVSAVQQSLVYIDLLTNQPTKCIDKQQMLMDVGRWSVITVEQFVWWRTLPTKIPEKMGNPDDWEVDTPTVEAEVQHQLDDIELLLEMGATQGVIDLLRHRAVCTKDLSA